MAFTEIDGDRQIQDLTIGKGKLKADFLEGANLDLTDGNNNATLTGLADGVANDDAVNKGQMDSAIAAAIVGAMEYKGVIDASDATGATLDGALTGYFYYVSVAGTLDGKVYNIGDHLVVNADITDFDVDGAGKIDIIDNTESSDILRTSDIQNNLTTVAAGDVLDASQGKILKDAQDAQQLEIDAIETGAGLATDGTYVTPSGSNYIDTSVSLADADSKLDAAIKVNEDAISAFGAEVFSEKPVVTNGSPVLAALANLPVKAGTARVYLNGMRQNEGAGNDYTINEATGVITFGFNLKDPKDIVIVDYKY